MTERSGIPASEAAELEGLQYRAALARKEFGDTVHVLAERVVHHPAAGQVAMRLTEAAVRRVTASSRRAARDELAQFTQFARNRARAVRDGNSWAPVAAAAGAALVVGVLAVAIVRRRQLATPALRRRLARG